MESVRLKKADLKDQSTVVGFDYRLNEAEHLKLRRKEKIAEAIANEECFLIMLNHLAVGFVIFNYRFFDQGWIELIIIEEKYRAKGIGMRSLNLICDKCKTNKVFTSTNTSNMPMQRALAKAGFKFAGEVDGLDEGDPELFYYKKLK